AWPGAGREVRVRTRLVLPLDEPGLVSFSMASRPGVSFLNVRGKTILDLADDLLHETAHHRLHAIEERSRLFTNRALEDRDGAGEHAVVFVGSRAAISRQTERVRAADSRPVAGAHAASGRGSIEH